MLQQDKTGLPMERVYNKIQDWCWDEVLSKYICMPELLDYVQCFTGPSITAMHTMLINKPPDAGTKVSFQVCAIANRQLVFAQKKTYLLTLFDN